MDPSIVVNHLGKRFRRFDSRRPATLHAALAGGFRRLRPLEHYWALQDVSFSVSPGEALGVVGRNGAGKSTLLRLIGGIGRPDQGLVRTRGRVNAIFDLGIGFHPDLTGRENVMISGVIAGLRRAEVAANFDAIVSFAELDEFIDSPIRTYSSGMQMRLAFAVMAHSQPEILLIDEVLAVGDLAFQRKCLERIAQFKAVGCAIVLVTHEMGPVEQFCDQALWLRAGRLAACGAPRLVIEAYKAEMAAETRRRTSLDRSLVYTGNGTELRPNENRFGSFELEIVSVSLLDKWGGAVSEIDSGAPLRVVIDYTCTAPLRTAIFGVTISRDDGVVCFESNTVASGVSGRGGYTLELDSVNLNSGLYCFDIGAYQAAWEYAFDYHWHAYQLRVRSQPTERGLMTLGHRWRAKGVNPESQ